MKIGKKTIGLGIGFLLLSAAFLWMLRKPEGGTVQVLQDGNVLCTFRLGETEDRLFEVEYEGRKNVVQIEDGRIRVLEADCPDQICVGMGWLDSAAPIVCLPNRLVIQYTDLKEGSDAVAR